ncbi:ribosomal protein L14-domain-containing protein [Truncatella angustata]|uniref:Ribosomal protein L14-domain-containing protein n=1 Tax=Truncatella angustata TaxID=152316 RepID=A0A9P8UH38_9PEZI|nr:ribosomal protein L14-domain-containing protein [Truncatella angustata]KAH6651912.1 ribosomal protein L14-domain-containing protein [Truncatella angustata]KAH8205641.1 hypothetical protein TruAng_000135 [Truncatella angustata]
MAETSIISSGWRNVQVGRVLLLQAGPSTGRLATIVEIIDHKRVLVDGPSADAKLFVPRQSIALKDALLAPFVIEKLPRGARTGAVKAAWEKAEIDSKWKNSNWAKTKAQREARKNLTDFERFQVLRLKKQRRFEQRKALAKVKASS